MYYLLLVLNLVSESLSDVGCHDVIEQMSYCPFLHFLLVQPTGRMKTLPKHDS